MEKKNKPIVSVCTSVHNTSALLPRCIESVVNQTYQNIQFVLVNNGSTDNSEDVMYEYKENHPERDIVIVRQEDKGLAQGRQSGVNNATGDYILLLDADDYYTDSHAIERIVDTALKTDADIVEFCSDRDGRVISSRWTGLMKSEVVLKDYLQRGGSQMLWLRMYRKSLFTPAVFPETYTNNEDIFAYPCLLYNARSIYYMKDSFHKYSSDNEVSVMVRMKNDPLFSERYFKAKSKSLLTPQFFENYVGKEYALKNHEILEGYMANVIMNFLQTSFRGFSWSNKVNKVLSSISFITKEKMLSFVKNNAYRYSFVGKLLSVVGVRNTCRIIGLRNKLFS